MPPASGRLSIALLPRDADAPIDVVEALWANVQGLAHDEIVPGGFLRARLETHPDVRFYSNWLGGFAARCPGDGTTITDRFARALERWRAGGDRAVECACGARHDLSALSFAPEAGFARGCVWLLDVADGALVPAFAAQADAVLGGVRVVLRRG